MRDAARQTETRVVTLAVLAGGEGRRMGMAKALVQVRGRPILEHLLESWNWEGPTLLVTAPGREHPPGHERFDREVADPVRGGGPLRGVLTALGAATGPMVVVSTVDMPLVRGDQLAWIAGQLEARPQLCGIMLRRSGAGGARIEPFPSAFRVSAREIVAAQLDAGCASVWRLSQLPGFAAIDAPADWPAETWTNWNTPEDLPR